MKSIFKILFCACKNYVTKDGDLGIMVRISLNGQRTQFSTKLQYPLVCGIPPLTILLKF